MELLFLIVVAFVAALRFGKKHRVRRPAERRSQRQRARPASVGGRKAPQPEAVRPSISPPNETVLFGRAFVTDGDGLRVKGTEIRLFGIDAPEFAHPYGKKAKWALVSLCKGQDILAVSAETDDYGRAVARCFLSDGRDLSAEMVKLGLALDWPKFSGGIYGHLEPADARKKLWLAKARQEGRLDIWEKFEARRGD